MPGSPKFAIIGSCCTRDLFEFGLPGLSPGDVALYIARTTAVSMLAQPFPEELRWWDAEELTGFHLERFAWDLDKRQLPLLEETPWDVLLVDLVTEYHPTLHVGASAVAAVPEVRHYLDRVIEKGAGDLIQARADLPDTLTAIRGLSARRAAIAAGRPVLVHPALRARWYLEDGVRRIFPAVGTIDAWNAYMQVLYGTLLDGSDFTELRVPSEALIAGGEHRWQRSPLHYDRSYYEALGALVCAQT